MKILTPKNDENQHLFAKFRVSSPEKNKSSSHPVTCGMLPRALVTCLSRMIVEEQFVAQQCPLDML